MFQSLIVPLLLPLLLLSHPATCCRQRTSFHPILTSNCVSPVHYQVLDVGIATCAFRCRAAPRCRDFAMETAASDQQLCLLFSFDACSSELLLDPSSWSSGCSSRKLRVFVKQSEGLEPGRLCPAGYRWVSGVSGSRFKGSLYKAARNGQQANWTVQADSCRSRLSSSDGSDMPLTKLVDLSSVEEIKDLRASAGLSVSNQIWVSAIMLSNGSWIWPDCGWPLPPLDTDNGGVWHPGKATSDYEADRRARIQDFGLNDNRVPTDYDGVCECVDPFQYF